MERRTAIRQMALAAGTIVSLPTWAKGWKKADLHTTSFLNTELYQVLEVAVEAIIPETDTPGAGEIGVGAFVALMVKDCYDTAVQNNFSKGLAEIEASSKSRFNKSFSALQQSDKLQVLKSFEKGSDKDQKSFIGLLKNLTIQGYMNSEYVMTNLTHYEMVPARYHGCVPVKG
ncbi:gluconate 2-dehydrogenase subunit 3-like protein [Dyadobacter jejuensis]|uniref:Gluconate 2-dehydrogenase subunit 3-like protein n=1 Tax=Dyadobacter jejuensis TaxID=1082580 RepID=A0A316AQ51_9BACT|nr:gluconate 2-dehydrogenase subunit 3 family protein [Dyadobacter jejuensis]PWJ59389.1 gluconate 2-dehydrogenase subunit 3-like protein [Dyadobacter jejuensis]